MSTRVSQERIPHRKIPMSGSDALRSDSCSAFDQTLKDHSQQAELLANINLKHNSSVSSPYNKMESGNKLHRLNEARREWENRHCSNSPFRLDRYGSSNSIGLDTISQDTGSPMNFQRGFGVRSTFQNQASNTKTSNQPINITNSKQSSFYRSS